MQPTQVKREQLGIAGPVGRLEAMLESPATHSVPLMAVICHPHPQFQGTMLNKVVHTLARSCTDQGMPALRFNYRGVGASEGQYDDGEGETLDAAAVVRYMRERYPHTGLVLAGFSFGSAVVLRLAQSETAQMLIVVAPPVGRLGVPDQVDFAHPWLVAQGTDDELVSSEEVIAWTRRQTPEPDLVVMDGVTHFFHGHLNSLRQHVGEFVARQLQA